MTPRDFLTKLSALEGAHRVNIPDFSIATDQCDVMAAKLLLWLDDAMWDDATAGDLIDVLNAALWWHLFFSSNPDAEQKGKSEK